MKPYYTDEHVTLYHGDAREIAPSLEVADVVITDPMWPSMPADYWGMSEAEVWKVWADVAEHFPRLAGAGRLLVILGQFSDPRFLTGVPASMPFFQLVHMPRVPPKYRGSRMVSEALCYVFGPGWLSVKGTRIIPARAPTSTSDGRRRSAHPWGRDLRQMEWLVHNYTRPGQTILDPFAGSGTTLLAARSLDRRAVGIEIREEYCEMIARGLGQRRLWGPGMPEPIEEGAPCSA